MNHLKSIVVLSLACSLFVFASGVTQTQAAPQKNVLLICVDDLKPALGCYGDALAKTPNIDRLAARGMRFEKAYCNQAVCAASRNTLFLGSRTTSLGVYSLSQNFRQAAPDAVTMPQHFRKFGYHAAAVGKLFHTGHGNVDDAASWSEPTVIEKVIEYLKPESTEGGKLTREEAYFTNQMLDRIKTLPRGAAWEMADVPDNAYGDGRVADIGIERLRAASQNPDQRFFLALGFAKPHLPFSAPQKYWDMHDPQKFNLASFGKSPSGAPDYAGKKGGEIANFSPVDGPIGPDLARQLIHGYYAAASYSDAQLGRVLDELDSLGLAENTIIALWGDHGWHLGDHGYWTKHTNYEQANRIPIIIVAPGVTTPGSSTQQMTETVDLYPTLAELAGLPAPTGPQPIDGLSLVPVLRNGDERIRNHAYHCFPKGGKMGRAIRTSRYRLVEWKSVV